MKALLFDYDAGNLHSLQRALQHLGVATTIGDDPAARADELLVLPGVGAFGLAADRLAPRREAVRAQVAAGRPVLGICLGMQLLFDRSDEDGGRAGRGLGCLPGAVVRLGTRRVPHIGWAPVGNGPPMYFAHSFVCRASEPSLVVAEAQHEDERFAAIVRRAAIVGVQFHPEKSSTAGLSLLGALLASLAGKGAP